MAVYERNYGRYQGPLTPPWSRFLILPRYAAKDVFDSRLFVAFYALCFLLPFAGLLMIYLHHNLAALKFIELPLDELKEALPINATFFRKGIEFQSWLCFLMALFVGPALVAPDLRNNGLPLYLSRPFSRSEYVLGKMTVLVVLMSLVTWIPGLLLFFFQGYLEGGGWLGNNLRIGAAIFAGSWAWLLAVSLVALAISAWVKWKPVARVSLLIVFFVLAGFAEALNVALDTWWGNLLSLSTAMNKLWFFLFGQEDTQRWTQPVWAAWLTIILGCALSLWLLSRRVRAYEVVR
ncbi:MAG TPA: ABC-2 transporter permease [Thermoanaerobaculia bacterium]|jgi:ABC-2 type transport system permease protein|nr:ABC-2 transporter permease [Thermoanaerobaculia bacterium]